MIEKERRAAKNNNDSKAAGARTDTQKKLRRERAKTETVVACRPRALSSVVTTVYRIHEKRLLKSLYFFATQPTQLTHSLRSIVVSTADGQG